MRFRNVEALRHRQAMFTSFCRVWNHKPTSYTACLVHETRYNIGSELVVKESVRAVVCATKACLLHRLIADKLSVYRIRLESMTPCADYIFLCGGK